MKRSIKKVFLLGAMSMGLIVVLNSCSESERESGNLGAGIEVKSPEVYEGLYPQTPELEIRVSEGKTMDGANEGWGRYARESCECR